MGKRQGCSEHGLTLFNLFFSLWMPDPIGGSQKKDQLEKVKTGPDPDHRFEYFLLVWYILYNVIINI